MAKVLITGANGFLGSWVVKALLAEGHEVFALVRKTSDLSQLEGLSCEYRYGDVTDKASLKNAFIGMDSIFHLAGLISYRTADRQQMELVNVNGTKNVVDIVTDLRIRRLVYLSSVVAVGAGFNPQQILNEQSPYNLKNLNLGYFETKHLAELLVLKAVKEKRIDAVILNPATIYGPGDAKKASRKNQVRVAQGAFPFYTSGGVSVVDIEDVVSGILSGWVRGRSGERYILSGENILIKDLFSMIAHEAGKKPPRLLLPKWTLQLLGSFGDFANSHGWSTSLSREQAYTATLYHWFDSSKAQRELDFRPRTAQISIAKSVKWMKENGLI